MLRLKALTQPYVQAYYLSARKLRSDLQTPLTETFTNRFLSNVPKGFYSSSSSLCYSFDMALILSQNPLAGNGDFCSCSVHIARKVCYTISAATSNHGNPTAAREVNPVIENTAMSFVVGIVSSLVAAWLYDTIRNSGKH